MTREDDYYNGISEKHEKARAMVCAEHPKGSVHYRVPYDAFECWYVPEGGSPMIPFVHRVLPVEPANPTTN